MTYGLRLNMTREFHYRSQMNPGFALNGRQIFRADLLSFNFSENGFRNLSLVGQEAVIYQNGLFRAAEGEDDSPNIAKSIFWGATALGLGVIAITVVSTSSNDITK